MKTDEQRIAIAKACGWTQVAERPSFKGAGLLGVPDTASGLLHAVPDYLNDLNAMHDAVSNKGLCHADYLAHLWNACGLKRTSIFWDAENFTSLMVVSNATAAQRAEAFLRTLGLWTE